MNASLARMNSNVLAMNTGLSPPARACFRRLVITPPFGQAQGLALALGELEPGAHAVGAPSVVPAAVGFPLVLAGARRQPVVEIEPDDVDPIRARKDARIAAAGASPRHVRPVDHRPQDVPAEDVRGAAEGRAPGIDLAVDAVRVEATIAFPVDAHDAAGAARFPRAAAAACGRTGRRTHRTGRARRRASSPDAAVRRRTWARAATRPRAAARNPPRPASDARSSRRAGRRHRRRRRRTSCRTSPRSSPNPPAGSASARSCRRRSRGRRRCARAGR